MKKNLIVGGVALALLVSPIAGAPSPAWATGTTPDPTPSSAAPVAAAENAAPNAGPASNTRRPRGCSGVTPKRPWRLVAARPDPTASVVEVRWSAVGCTTGYRINIAGTGVDRHVDVAGGSTSSATIADLPPSTAYRITVTSVGASGDGGVSGSYRLHGTATAARSDLTIDFPDAGPGAPVAASTSGASPWINPELTWTSVAGQEPQGYRLLVIGNGGATVVDKTVPGSVTKARLGDAVSAGVSYTVTVTPVFANGSEGETSRLKFGDREAPRPEQVTGNSPVVQFSPVTAVSDGRVLGYEIAFGPKQTAKHVFVAAPTTTAGSATPWVAVDPSFAAVDASETAVPMATMVAAVRTITTVGKSGWTAARTITHTEVATVESSYFAGIGHVDAARESVPRNGFLKVHGTTADLQVTDLVWSRSAHQQAIPVTVAVYGPTGSAAPAVVQDVPVTHLPDVAQDAWRATDIPLPEGWTSVVLRREGRDVATWVNRGGKPCVAAVSYGDAPTDLPAMWKDSWCAA